LPPRVRLDQVVRSLVRRLPLQLGRLLAHGRFESGARALARLGEDAHLSAALEALGEGEAAWLADEMLARWSLVGEALLDPVAALVAPPEVWIGEEPVRVRVELRVVGAEPGWDAEWDGAQAVDASQAVVVATPGAATVGCRAHVRARTAGGRIALTASARIAVRRPSVSVRDDLRRLVVVDQQGSPAVGVRLRIGDSEHVTGPGGLVDLEQAAPRGATLLVEGILAGRIAAQK
jgi:hypothetical protein